MERIFDAQVSYYVQSQPKNISLQVSDRRTFLPLTAQPISPGEDPQFGLFAQGDWALLNIAINQPLYFSYSVEAEGQGKNARFYVVARGDLDGDSAYSRYEMYGKVNSNNEVVGRNIIYSLDPLE